MGIRNGEWIISGELLQNSNVVGIFTTLLSYGREIKPAEFEKYKDFLTALPLNTSHPVFTKITPASAKIPSIVITYYKDKGETLERVTKYFESFIAAYATKNPDFYSYWGEKERKNLDEINSAKNRLITLESPVMYQLEKCNKDGYKVLGISEIGTIIILYVATNNGEFFPFFLRKHSSGELKFVASSSYGGCSLYMTSFFNSPAFEDSFRQSSSTFSNPEDINSAINFFRTQIEKH